jgi:hypothetical protein
VGLPEAVLWVLAAPVVEPGPGWAWVDELVQAAARASAAAAMAHAAALRMGVERIGPPE